MNGSSLQVSAEPNHGVPNPQRSSCYSRHTTMEREVWCQNYDECLDCAVKEQWEGFTCSHCGAFQSITMTSDWLAQEADRCRALVYILTNEDVRGKHFRRLIQYFRMERADFQSDVV